MAMCQPGYAVDYEKTLLIKKSEIPGAGRGVFATVRIPAGTYIGNYEGKYITEKEYQVLLEKNTWHYVMGLHDCSNQRAKGYVAIDGRDGSIATKINYAPKEFRNVVYTKYCEDPQVRLTTLRDIEPGEELYMDYGPFYIYDFMEKKEIKDFFEKKRLNKKTAAMSKS